MGVGNFTQISSGCSARYSLNSAFDDIVSVGTRIIIFFVGDIYPAHAFVEDVDSK